MPHCYWVHSVAFVCRVFIQSTVFNFNHRHFVNGVENAIGIFVCFSVSFPLSNLLFQPSFIFIMLFSAILMALFNSISFFTLDIYNDNINNVHVFSTQDSFTSTSAYFNKRFFHQTWFSHLFRCSCTNHYSRLDNWRWFYCCYEDFWILLLFSHIKT